MKRRSVIGSGADAALAKLKTEYNGVEIKYNANTMRWEFTLDNVNRHADSVENAIRAIAAPRTKKPPFERFDCYIVSSWGSDCEPATVTSVLEVSDTGLPIRVMCVPRGSAKYGTRGTHHVFKIYPATPHNKKLVSEINSLKENAAEINKAITNAKNRMQAWTPTPVVDVQEPEGTK